MSIPFDAPGIPFDAPGVSFDGGQILECLHGVLLIMPALAYSSVTTDSVLTGTLLPC